MSLLENTPTAWSRRADDLCSPHDAVGWSIAGQRERFAAVLTAVQPQEGERLLDYGCGTGAFSAHMPDRVGYWGFDWAEGMIARAVAEHSAPGRSFSSVLPLGTFDIVVCVGTFNLPSNWDKQRTAHVIRHLWDTTGCRVLAASLYAGGDRRCLIYTEDEVEQLGKQLAYGAKTIRHRSNDLLLVARR